MKPFWSDDFDMDLPKIIPDARDLLGELADAVPRLRQIKSHHDRKRAP